MVAGLPVLPSPGCYRLLPLVRGTVAEEEGMKRLLVLKLTLNSWNDFDDLKVVLEHLARIHFEDVSDTEVCEEF